MNHGLIFSLIVPTINRTTELKELLASLCLQTIKNFEVLVVDQNEDDRALNVINEFLDRLTITHIRMRGKGASRARNAGLSKAKGNIITFPDDDCEYSPDLLEKILQAFNDHPTTSGITTRSANKNFDGHIARFSKKKKYISKYNILWTLAEFTIFLKSTCVRNTYFDEAMGVGASTPWESDEGPDLVLRLINKGARFVYLPDIIIYHPDPVKKYDEKAIIRSYRYGNGRGKYLRKHNYPLWFVSYVLGLYLAGIVLGCLQFNAGKIKYYWSGLKGRIEGYINTKKETH